MKRKIIAAMLCAAMIFTAFSGSAAAEEAAFSGTDSLSLMKTLGVFPSDVIPGEALTRRELAQIFFRIIMPDMAEEEYIPSESRFTDIGEEDFAANFVSDIGIMNGVGDRLFAPDNRVTYAEIVKALVCFLGYRDMAEGYGGWPEGYKRCGVKFGFAKYYGGDQSYATTDAAAALFKEAIDVNLAEILYYTNRTESAIDLGISYLEEYMGIYIREGIVSANYLENLYTTGKTTNFDEIRIDNGLYLLSDGALQLKEYLGCKTRVYAKQRSINDTPEILHYEIRGTKETKINCENIISYSNATGILKYYDAKNRQAEFNIGNAYILYNNSLCESYGEETINPFSSNADLDGYINIIDNNSDGIADVVHIRVYESYVVSKISNSKIYVKYHPENVFDIAELKDGELAVKNVVGETIALSQLDSGDIISVFIDKSGEIREITVSVDTYSGKVEEIIRDSLNPTEIKLDGKYFKFANRLSGENQSSADIKTGTRIQVFFDFNGRIADIEKDAFSSEHLGYLVDMKPDSVHLRENVYLKLLTDNDEMLSTKLSDKVNLNKVRMDDTAAMVQLGYTNGSPMKRQIVKYIYDKETDCITDLTSVDESIDQSQDGFYKFQNLTAGMLNHYRASTMSFKGKLLLNAATVVFVVPNEASRDNEDAYRAMQPSYFDDGTNTVTFDAYGSKKNNPVAEALVVETDGNVEKTYKYTSVIVIKKIEKRLKDGDYQTFVTAWRRGAEEGYFADGDALEISGEPLGRGDVLEVGFNKSNEIVIARRVFDADLRAFDSRFTQNPTDANQVAADRYLYGTVDYFNEAVMTVATVDLAPGAQTAYEHYPVSGLTVYEYNTENGKPEIIKTDSSVIHDEKNNNYPAKIFLYTKNAVAQFAIVYHD